MHLCNTWYKELTAHFPATQDNQYYQFLGILSGWFLYITIFSHHHLFWCRNATTQNHLLKSATCLCYFHAWHLLTPPSTLRIKVRPIIMSYKASTWTGFIGPCQAYFQYLQASYRDQTYPTSSASVFLLLFLCLKSFCFLWLIFLISGSTSSSLHWPPGQTKLITQSFPSLYLLGWWFPFMEITLDSSFFKLLLLMWEGFQHIWEYFVNYEGSWNKK